jgi:hypothetical protein
VKHDQHTLCRDSNLHQALRCVPLVSLVLGINAGCSGRADSVSDDDSASTDVSPLEAHVDVSLNEPEASDVVPNDRLCRLSIGETTFAEMRELLGHPQKSLPGTLLGYDWGETEGRYLGGVEYLHLDFVFDPNERLEYASGEGARIADCIKAWEPREWNLLQHRKTSTTNTATADLQHPLDYAPLPTSDVLCQLKPGETTYVLNGSDFGVDGALPLFTARKFAADSEVREYRFGDLQTGNVSSIYLYFQHDILEDIVTYNLTPRPPCWE